MYIIEIRSLNFCKVELKGYNVHYRNKVFEFFR